MEKISHFEINYLLKYWNLIFSLVVGNYQIDNPGFCKPTGLYILHSKTCKRRIIPPLEVGTLYRTNSNEYLP